MENKDFINYNEIALMALKKIDSTQDFAKKIIIDKKIWQNTMILAFEQTKGRGTGNKLWSSPKGNLYSSFVFKLPPNKPLSEVSFVSAKAVIKTLVDLGLNAKCKWVNDIFVNMRKICGILVEQVGEYAIIGTGINIVYYPKTTPFYEATSLLREGIEIDVRDLLTKYSQNLSEAINSWVRFGFESVLDYWKAHALWLNETVRILDTAGNLQYEGIFTDVDKDGALFLKVEDGAIKKIISGSLTPRYET